MKVGEVFSDSVRRSDGAALARGGRRLHVDVEQDLGVVADEADRDDEEPLRAPFGALRDQVASSSGPIHGSGVRPAL